MLLGVSSAKSLWLALAIVVGGVVTGLLAGLFGIGGGAVIVPVLYEVFRVLGVPEEVRMQLCVGTSIAIILPTTIRSYLTHRAKGLVIPQRDPAVGAAGRDRRQLRRGDRGVRAACGVQDRFRRRSRASSRPNSCSPATAGISAPNCPVRCR